MRFKHLLLVGTLLFYQIVNCQNKVSITIDDVPNTTRFEKDGYQSKLLKKLDSLEIPIAIFINEGLIYKTNAVAKNFELLNNWVKNNNTTLGNHTFSHARYSTTGIDLFENDIVKGAFISRELSKKYKKPLNYFRFPYNDLGKDSLQHSKMKNFLIEKKYSIAPFTIESSDWMYNMVYEYYLDNNELKKANEIGADYVAKTLEYFDFFEILAKEDYNSAINQIYLCHDNKLNADFLPILIAELNKRAYKFISLEEALTDKIYDQKDNYFQKWGISWMYRWKTNQKERIKKMKQEPSTEKIMVIYDEILKARNNSK